MNVEMLASKTEAEIKNELWENSQQNKVIENLRNGVSLQEIMNTMDDLDQAFAQELDTLVCSDERITLEEGGRIGVAGQMIMANEEDIDNFVKNYKGKVKKVLSHDDCGAVKTKYSQEDAQQADFQSREFTKNLAARLGAEFGHISQTEMREEFHDARGLCFDATGSFNPNALKLMPNCFVVSGPGFGLSQNYLKKEVKILSGIALGGHGFGDKFTKENPFYIFVSASNAEDGEKFSRLAEEIAIESEGKIKVESFIYNN